MASFLVYIKAAFKHPWNLLLAGAGTVFGFISGKPDIVLPIVAAGELTYLAATAGNSRFQHWVDHYQNRTAGQIDAGVQKRFDELYQGLDPAARALWNDLRARCTGLGEATGTHLDAFAEEQLAGVNKLLWVHLKLLHTKARLERFFASTDDKEIVGAAMSIGGQPDRLADLPAASATGPADPVVEKKRKSLEDTLATSTARRENVKRARDNYELVTLELARIAAKLNGVVELAANRQDPAALTSEVDDAARSVESTEQMMGELQLITGLGADDVEAPKIVSAGPRAAARALRQ